MVSGQGQPLRVSVTLSPSLVASQMSKTAKERLVQMNPLWILLGAQWVLGWDSRHGASSVQGRAAGRGIVPCPSALIQSLWTCVPTAFRKFLQNNTKTKTKQSDKQMTAENYSSYLFPPLRILNLIFIMCCIPFSLHLSMLLK